MNLTALLSFNDKTLELSLNKMTFFEELYVDAKLSTISIKKQQGTRLQLTIHPKQAIVLQNVRLQYQRNYHKAERIFCNGYQSQTESRELALNETILSPKWLVRQRLEKSGDGAIKNIERRKGHFHAWTYSYIRLLNGKMEFIGSLNEKTCFTIIQHDTSNDMVYIDQDCADLELKHSFPILDIIWLTGEDKLVFDHWQNLMEISTPKASLAIGWTSHRNYHKDVSEASLIEKIRALSTQKNNLKIIQIHEGYQEKMGDWLVSNSKFPNGMGTIAQHIHQKGYQASLWLAPFVCEKNARICQQHPHWILKDEQNNMIVAAYDNAPFGTAFYALDIYQQEVKDYLTKVFHVILNKWQYDMVHLDFLYAACLQSRPNKTRGQVMNDAMVFLKQLLGNKLMLASAVPLGSVFGMADYARIGANIYQKWTNPRSQFLGHPERDSTLSALRSTLGRWQLNGRFFQNTPSLFTLQSSPNKLNSSQEYTLLLIYSLLGTLLFCPDTMADYSAEQWGEYGNVEHWQGSQILKVESIGLDKYKIYFNNKGLSFVALCNLSSRKNHISLGKKQVDLEGFESLVLKV